MAGTGPDSPRDSSEPGCGSSKHTRASNPKEKPACSAHHTRMHTHEAVGCVAGLQFAECKRRHVMAARRRQKLPLSAA